MNCAFCNSRLTQIVDMGHVALAGAFLKPEQFAAEKKYPLRLMFCESCYVAQLADMVPSETLFRDYFYCSSATQTVSEHFDSQAWLIATMKPQTVLEIGCNDGVLLKELAKHGIPFIVGVDPSSVARQVPGCTVVNEFFTATLAKDLAKADVVVANNVFAHVEDIHDFTAGIATVLADNGVCLIEAHHLGEMVSGLQYDWLYHEHRYYYSLMTMEKHLANHGLSVVHVEQLPLHGGSVRYHICKTGKRPVDASVAILRNTEYSQKLHQVEAFLNFAIAMHGHRMEMRRVMDRLRQQDWKIAGYGASGRANTMLQWCDIAVDYMIDDSPVKQGYFTPGTHIPIYGREHLEVEHPDAALIFAWTYMDEIGERLIGYNGSLLVPLPQVKMRRFLVHEGRRMLL